MGHGQIKLEKSVGTITFILGPNGAGKSALIGSLASQVPKGKFRRITAHRQNWTTSDGPTFASGERASREKNVADYSIRLDRRYVDHDPQLYAGLALSRIISGENNYHRLYRGQLLASGKSPKEFERARVKSPLEIVNKILQRANLPLELSIKEDDTLQAKIGSSEAFGVSRLSDGERNAIFLCAEFLDAKPGDTLFVDEPERHLHQSIITPLLQALIRERTDCSIVVATHELALPGEFPYSSIILLQGVRWNGDSAVSYDADLLDKNSAIPEEIKKSILGARKDVLFIEGNRESLDLRLYSMLIPGVSVKAVGGCSNVIASVTRLRGANALHWVRAYGLIDRDGQDVEKIKRLEAEGIFALEFSTVEGLYYCSDSVTAVAAAKKDAEARSDVTALYAVATETLRDDSVVERVCVQRVVDDARLEVQRRMPTTQSRDQYKLEIDLGSMLENEKSKFLAHVDRGEVDALMQRYSLKSTNFYHKLASEIGFRNRKEFEAFLLDTVQENNDLREKLVARLGNLPRFVVAQSSKNTETSGHARPSWR